jgi:alpha-tubulin suppressor-like RCC1 family protein
LTEETSFAASLLITKTKIMKKLLLSFCILASCMQSGLAQKFDAGYQHSIMVCADSSVWFWGYYNTTNTPNPTKVVGVSDAIDVSLGSYEWLILKADSTVLGLQYNGTLAYWSLAYGLTGMVAIAGGESFFLMLKSDGTVWAQGDNSKGQLGDSTTISKSAPFQLTRINNVVAIAAGSTYSLALKSDGTVWAWGSNAKGQLGDSTTINKSYPVQVKGLTGIISICAGISTTNNTYASSYALKADSTLWAWGDNGGGQLGDSTKVNRLTPVKAYGSHKFISVSGGGAYAMAVKQDGTLWGWGNNPLGNITGSLGGSFIYPKQVTGITDVVAVAAGVAHTLAQKSDGTLYGWGWNEMGQCGNGNTSLYSAIDTVESTCTPSVITAIEQPISPNGKLKIFPNPNNGLFQIELPENTNNTSVQIFNMLGKIVYDKSYSEINDAIDIKDVAPGLYIIKVSIDHKISVSKFIKQ